MAKESRLGNFSMDFFTAYKPRERTLKLESILNSSTLQSIHSQDTRRDSYRWPYQIKYRQKNESDPKAIQIQKLTEQCQALKNENLSKLTMQESETTQPNLDISNYGEINYQLRGPDMPLKFLDQASYNLDSTQGPKQILQ